MGILQMRDFVRTDNSRRLLNLPNGSFPLLILIFQEKNWVFGFLAVQKTEQILYPFHIKVHCLSKEWSDIIYFDAIKVYVTYFPIPIFYKEKKQNESKRLSVYWLLIIMTMVIVFFICFLILLLFKVTCHLLTTHFLQILTWTYINYN